MATCKPIVAPLNSIFDLRPFDVRLLGVPL